MVLGLIAAVVLAHGSIVKAVAMVLLGLILGLVGTDGQTGGARFTFGFTILTDGIGFVPLAIGVFGVGEVIANLISPQQRRDLFTSKISNLWLTRERIPAGVAGGACAAR